MVRTSTKQLLSLDELILLHPLVADMNSKIWFELASIVVVDILLRTSFIDHIICGASRPEQKVVPWHWKTVDEQNRNGKFTHKLTIGTSEEEPILRTQKSV